MLQIIIYLVESKQCNTINENILAVYFSGIGLPIRICWLCLETHLRVRFLSLVLFPFFLLILKAI